MLPDVTGQGHGGRLLNAVADTLAEDGFRMACTWALSADGGRLSFLEAAGWAPDGSHSNLDMGVRVHVVRLHTRLSPVAWLSQSRHVPNKILQWQTRASGWREPGPEPFLRQSSRS